MSIVGKRLAAAGKAAILGAALCALAAPAMADSFHFSVSSGPRGYGHGPRHYHHPHYRPYRGPRVVFVTPPPVYYRPAPPVVYVPPPSAPLTVTPSSAPYRTADGRYCREYISNVVVGGRPQPSYGTACQMPDGSWHIVN